jgi:hypothetical protein
MGVMLGVLLFDSRRLSHFRPSWFDLPIVVWCGCSFVSSMTNGLGAYDGLSATFYKVIMWGLPYFIGRIYFTDLHKLRELAVAIFIGGLVYMPLCLLEMRISPQLHRLVYGFFQHDFSMTIRMGGYRPMVFMQHGLMVAMWMATASLAGLWLWQSNALKRLWGIPTAWLVFPLIGTTIMCRSMNSLGLLALGTAALYGTKVLKSRVPMLVLIAIAPLYLFARINGTFSGKALIDLTKDLAGADRAQSVEFRITNEDLLIGKAMQQPWFGWAGWNRMRVIDDDGKMEGITDGLWVIATGENGLVGLISITSLLLLPAAMLLWRMNPRYWDHPLGAPAAMLAVVITLHMIDNLPNGMFNPVYVLCVGAVASLRRVAVEEELEEYEYEGLPWRMPAEGYDPVFNPAILPSNY